MLKIYIYKCFTREKNLLKQSFQWLMQQLSLVVLLVRLEVDEGMKFFGRVVEEGLEIAHEAVHVPLAGRFVDDILVVVVAQTATQFFVIHFWFVLPDAPSAGHLVRVRKFEFPAVACPGDESLARLVRQQLQQELPQLDRAAACQHCCLNHRFTVSPVTQQVVVTRDHLTRDGTQVRQALVRDVMVMMMGVMVSRGRDVDAIRRRCSRRHGPAAAAVIAVGTQVVRPLVRRRRLRH